MRGRFAGMIGNIFEHYDKALFGLLAPFIAPAFFSDHDSLTALILMYAILPLGLLTRPLGAVFFGWIGDRFGRKYALSSSLFGIGIVTMGMGCLPTYREVGALAPIFLAIGRMLQNFCCAGESPGGAVFVLEKTAPEKRSLFSSFYSMSSLLGILLGSFLVSLFGHMEWIEKGWRFLFWTGGGTALFGVIVCLRAEDGKEFRKSSFGIMQKIRENRRALVSIILASGLSYTTYSLAFTFMNGYIPLVTALSKADVVKINTLLLVMDMALLPFFGYLAHRWGKEKVMLAASSSLVVGAIPLFSLLSGASLMVVIAVRCVIVVLGVAFSAAYHAWTMEQVDPENRYTILSLGTAIGSQMIGTPTSAVCLWLYQQINLPFVPGLYLMLIAGGAYFAVQRTYKFSFLSN